MQNRLRTLLVIWLLALGLYLAPGTLAEGAGIPGEPILEMLEGNDALKLTAMAANGAIECSADACDLSMEQTYWVHNTSKGASISTLLGLTADNGLPELLEVSLVQDGSGLPFVGADELHTGIWASTLLPDQHATLVLRYRHTLGSAAVIAAGVDLDRIVSKWGLPEGARVRFTLNDTVGDDAVIWMVPFISHFDGQQVAWDYEIPNELISHQLVMLRPDTWRRIKAARVGGNQPELAKLYLQVDQALAPLGLAERGYFGQAVAAFSAAIALEPDNADLHVALAQAYQQRAKLVPASQLNYEMLAVQELDTANRLAPADSNVTQQLAQAYYAVAQASAALGNQAAALEYLDRLRSTGLPAVESEETLLKLALRWSVELAEQGYNQVAYEQAHKLLPAETLQLLNEFSPPFISLATDIRIDAGSRLVVYTFQPYPGTAEQLTNQLKVTAELLKGITGLVVRLTEGTEPVLSLELRYNTLSELQRITELVRAAIMQDNRVLTTALGVPWQSAPEISQQNRAGIRQSANYREEFNTGALQASWAEQNQYAEWRLVEVTSQTQDDELQQLERRLTTFLLKQQQQIWRQLPASCSWEYTVSLDNSSRSDDTWILGWGEDRVLEVERTTYNQGTLRWFIGVSAGLVIAALVVLLFPWNARKRNNLR